MQDKTEDLLDYVHGRLDSAGRARVEQMLNEAPELQAELAVIKAVQKDMGQSDVLAEARGAGWSRLSAAIDADRMPAPANENRRFSLLQVAALVMAAVIGSQALTISFGGTDTGGFVPASVEAEGPVLQIAFRQEVRVDQMTPLLQNIGAVIVDGPSAMGLLTVQFADDVARDAGLAILSERSDLVELVSQP